MISNYYGHYLFDSRSIDQFAPELKGVYYCGTSNPNGSLGASYVGRAAGQGVTIRTRLQNHFQNDNWQDASHFGYIVCEEEEEAQRFELMEIVRLNPKYNKRLG